jgi:hypothetical protein
MFISYDLGTGELEYVTLAQKAGVPQVEASNDFFSPQEPMPCWFYNLETSELELRANAAEIKAAIDASLVVPEPEPIAPVVLSPVQFKLLFTPQERIYLKSQKATDPILEDFYELIDDPRLTEISLGLTSTVNGIDYSLSLLVAATIITAEEAVTRRVSILAGELQ